MQYVLIEDRQLLYSMSTRVFSGSEINITMSDQAFINFLVVRYGIIVIFRSIAPVIRQIEVDAIISGLGNVILIVLQRLLDDEHSDCTVQLESTNLNATFLLCAIVYTSCNHIPTAVNIS